MCESDVGGRTYRAVHASFRGKAEPARRRIVDLLASGEHTSGEIAEVLGHEFKISRTAVSKHLRVLRDAGFADVRADLQWRWYRLTPEAITILEGVVADLRLKWDRRVGWDADAHQLHDPLAHPPYWGYGANPVPFANTVPFKGPGRPYRRGKRGLQKVIPRASEPEAGFSPRRF